jgi:prolyl-tRNA synthetase
LADVAEVEGRIKVIGDRIRELKGAKAEKDAIKLHVDELLSLKARFLEVAGRPFDEPKARKAGKGHKTAIAGAASAAAAPAKTADSDFITPRSADYSAWYNDVIYAADMVDQSPVRGCMVIKPWGMGTWDLLRGELDERIRESGASNAYFPLFIPKSFMTKEAQHVEGFATECAVVTHSRLCVKEMPNGKKEMVPDPESLLEEPLIVRPTSETVIWDMFGRWIKSYRDLPYKVNQWANVVRWELRTRPFLRSAEFLWQEGHTAHATREEARECTKEMLDVYYETCKDMLAVPCVRGIKSPSERFAGADDTYTIEALMQNGWALQSGTSHFLGQNFAKAFDVFYQTSDGGRELVWATSWGVSTRLMGALVMTHGDDKGIVLPPPVAPVQVVIVPIGSDGDVAAHTEAIRASLKASKVRVRLDDRDFMRPGAKFFEWERKGVPLRIEVGPREVAAGTVMLATRHSGAKATVLCAAEDVESGSFAASVRAQLDAIHATMLSTAEARLKERTFTVDSYATMKAMVLAADKGAPARDLSQAGFYLAPWKCDADNEEAIKKDCKATVRCYPLEENKSPPVDGVRCFYSGDQATHWALFARAY